MQRAAARHGPARARARPPPAEGADGGSGIRWAAGRPPGRRAAMRGSRQLRRRAGAPAPRPAPHLTSSPGKGLPACWLAGVGPSCGAERLVGSAAAPAAAPLAVRLAGERRAQRGGQVAERGGVGGGGGVLSSCAACLRSSTFCPHHAACLRKFATASPAAFAPGHPPPSRAALGGPGPSPARPPHAASQPLHAPDRPPFRGGKLAGTAPPRLPTCSPSSPPSSGAATRSLTTLRRRSTPAGAGGATTGAAARRMAAPCRCSSSSPTTPTIPGWPRPGTASSG
jgi:hypothetical protein